MATLGYSHESLFLVKAPEGRKPETLDYSPIAAYRTPIVSSHPLFLTLGPVFPTRLFVTKASVL